MLRGPSSASLREGEKPSPPLAIDAVTAGYSAKGSRSNDVLHGITLNIAAGELTVIIGANGAGKSTLLRVLAGTLRPRLGIARLFGQDLSSLSRREVARRVAVVSQGNEVALGFRVEQVVMMGRSPHQGGLHQATADDRKAAEEALSQTGIQHLAGRLVSELSGGEQKLVALARAFAQASEVLLLDEPSAHLDPHHSVGLFELLTSRVRHEQLTCVAIAHDLNLAAAFADRIVLLHEGTVRAQGTVDQVMTADNLDVTFGVELQIGRAGGTRFFVPRRSTPASGSP